MITATTPSSCSAVMSGIVLRSWLVLTLRARGGTATVRQLCDALDQQGLTVAGRPSKTVSDALRWEVGRGRVRHVARSCYAVGHLPRQTAWRMRQRIRDHRA